MTDVPKPCALLPLTIFDDAWSPTNFSTGWLVEDVIDETRLRNALSRLTYKWRLLAGRLERGAGGTDTKWLLRIPLGDIPANYETFSLTSRVSEEPLSRYVSLPPSTVSRFPPEKVFISPSIPHDSEGWATQRAPLTLWHLTYFPSIDPSMPSHTCVGFTWPHGAFDGVGASLILRALEDELRGRDWKVPYELSEGYNANPLQSVLDDSAKDDLKAKEYKGMRAIPWWLAILGLLWCAWETWWLNAQYRLVIVPKNVYQRLAEDVRAQLRVRENDGPALDINPDKITSSDVLTAFLFKALYDADVRPQLKINCTYFIQFRRHLASDALDFAKFPHNTFVPQSLVDPLTTVSSLRETSLADVACEFARSRLNFDSTQAFATYRFLCDLSTKRGFLFHPVHPEADEALMVSNVSAQRIPEFDWTAFGAGRTLSSYRYNTSRLPVRFTMLFSLAGRLQDGSALLDGVLTEKAWNRLQTRFERLIEEYT